MIETLGTEELGKQIKRPSRLVRKMLEKHNLVMAGGVPLPDDEYEIAVEQWKQIAEPVEIKSGLETIQLTCLQFQRISYATTAESPVVPAESNMPTPGSQGTTRQFNDSEAFTGLEVDAGETANREKRRRVCQHQL